MSAHFPFRLRLRPRHLIDIGWRDLFAAARFDEGSGAVAPAVFGWADGRTAVACLSERTGFDALLKALEPPAGAEIVTGAINIGAMAEIAAHHGLTVRPVDISLDTLLPDAEAVRATMTPRTALVLIAHLHGASDPLEEIAGVCRERGVPLVEDGAQAWSDTFRGSPHADVSLFSFGPIKTSTALGGGVVACRDPALTERVAEVLAVYAPMPDAWFRRRLAKYAGLKAATRPEIYAALVQALRLSGRDPDAVIGGSARGFAATALIPQLRRAPPGRLSFLLSRRLAGRTVAEARRGNAADLLARLRRQEAAPGRRARAHARWLTPVMAVDPDRLIRDLRRAGLTPRAERPVSASSPAVPFRRPSG